MPRLFISYKREDTAAVMPIVDWLKDLYFEVWIDVKSIPGGANWRQEIEKGITRADWVLLMLSPEACASPYVKEEIDYARSLGRPILPLQIRPVKVDDQDKLDVEPLNYIDFTNPDSRFAREKLLDTLPPPLRRDRRHLDPEVQARHRAYLRTLFDRYGKINLRAMLDRAPRETVDLFEVYVPLFLGLNIWADVKDGKLVDWWILPTDDKGNRQSVPENVPEAEHRPKTFPSMSADAVMLDEIVRRNEAFVADLASREKGIADGAYPTWRFESEELPALSSRLVITGDPGSGKSTLMRHLALAMAEDMLYEEREKVAGVGLARLGFWPLPAYTPVFVELRALVQQAFPSLEDEVTLDGFHKHLEAQLKPYACTEYLPDLKEQLEDGDAMIFLDGLDEIPEAGEEERRKQIKRLVGLLSTHYEGCRILITSRPYAYNTIEWQLEGFGHARLVYLDQDRLEQLALKLFGMVLGGETAKAEAARFQERVGELKEGLRRNPLLFTLLAELWLVNQDQSPDKRLPPSEGAIYRECVELLLGRWTRKDLSGESLEKRTGVSQTDLRTILEDLAYRVHSEAGPGDDPSQFSGGDVYNAVRQVVGKRTGIDVTLLMDYLAQRAGVLYEFNPRGDYRFAHRSFQEHLAAACLARDGHFPQTMLAQYGANPVVWRNVANLLPDEALRQKRDLWKLVEAVLDPDVPEDTATLQTADWQRVVLASRTLVEHLSKESGRTAKTMREQAAAWLAALVNCGALTPIDRAEAGRLLGILGDPRPGVLAPHGVPEFAWCEVPAGKFRMGGDPDAYKAWDGAEFALGYPFWIAKYPVIYAQYEAFVSAKGYENETYWTPDGLRWRGENRQPEAYWNDPKWHIPNHPVVGVTWYEAYAFTQWLNEQPGVKPANMPAGYVIRLARECEWEKAARYPDGRFFPWGNDWDPARLNWRESGIGRTSAVGVFPNGANPAHGACDLCGNVWEWCLTQWQDEYQSPDREGNDPESDARRVLRGGSWGDSQDFARAASRGGLSPYRGYSSGGFRVVCASPI